MSVPDAPASSGSPDRPLGIAVLAVLHAIGGLILCGLFVLVVTKGAVVASTLIGWVIMVAIPLMIILAFASAFGLRRGKKWAWWLATVYYFQFVFGGVAVLATIAITTAVLDRAVTERIYELGAKHVLRLAVFSLLTWYMTRSRVFAYFGFTKLTRFRALAISCGVVLAVAAFLAPIVLIALLQNSAG